MLASVLHVTANPVDWYAARACGIVAYLLLSAAVVLGLTLSSKKVLPQWPRFAVEDLHRFLGILTGVFLFIHIGAIALDAYLPFSITQLVVPYAASYRPLWTALGIVALELLLALAVSNHYRKRLPQRLWRRLHYLNFLIWAAATFHGLGSGTDRQAPWFIALYAIAVGLVSGLLVWRLLRRRFEGLGPQILLPGASAATSASAVVAFVLFASFAGLQPGPLPQSFSEAVSGQIVVERGASEGIVSMVGQGKGVRPVIIRADLLLSQTQSTPKSTAFQMEYLPSGARCSGTLTNVQAQGFTAVCRLPDGQTRHVSASWKIGAQASDSSNGANSLAGTLTVQAQ